MAEAPNSSSRRHADGCEIAVLQASFRTSMVVLEVPRGAHKPNHEPAS